MSEQNTENKNFFSEEHEEINFKDLISNIFSNPEKWIKHYDDYPVPVITIENFKIKVADESTETFSIELDELFKIFQSYLHGKSLNIIFSKNIFISNENKMITAVKIKLSDDIYITFTNNIFQQVDLSLLRQCKK